MLIILFIFQSRLSMNKSYEFDTSIDYSSLILLKFTHKKKITQLRVNTQLKTSMFNLLDISDFIDSCSSYNNYTYICNSSIYYAKEEISSSYFFFLNKKMAYSSDNRDYGISFSYSHDNLSYSLIEQLYQSNKISARKFSFENKVFRIGEAMLYQHFAYIGSCSVKSALNTWGCQVKSIGLNDVEYDFYQYAYISTEIDNTINSKELFDLIIDKVFKEYFANKHCGIFDDIDWKDSLSCDNETYNNLTNITIRFDNDMTMEIPFQDMFYFDGRYYLSLFSYDYSYSNRLEIGFGLIKNLNKTIFDYDKGTVSFFSNRIIIKTPPHKEIRPFVYIVIDILCSADILMIVYVYIYKYINLLTNKEYN